MAKSKAKSKIRNQPLTISIHGKGIDIDASFQDNSTMSEAVGAIASRIAGVATPPIVEASDQYGHRFRELVTTFAESLRPEQQIVVFDALDPSQKILAFEILNRVNPTGRPNGATAAHSEDSEATASPSME